MENYKRTINGPINGYKVILIFDLCDFENVIERYNLAMNTKISYIVYNHKFPSKIIFYSCDKFNKMFTRKEQKIKIFNYFKEFEQEIYEENFDKYFKGNDKKQKTREYNLKLADYYLKFDYL